MAHARHTSDTPRPSSCAQRGTAGGPHRLLLAELGDHRSLLPAVCAAGWAPGGLQASRQGEATVAPRNGERLLVQPCSPAAPAGWWGSTGAPATLAGVRSPPWFVPEVVLFNSWLRVTGGLIPWAGHPETNWPLFFPRRYPGMGRARAQVHADHQRARPGWPALTCLQWRPLPTVGGGVTGEPQTRLWHGGPDGSQNRSACAGQGRGLDSLVLDWSGQAPSSYPR